MKKLLAPQATPTENPNIVMKISTQINVQGGWDVTSFNILGGMGRKTTKSMYRMTPVHGWY